MKHSQKDITRGMDKGKGKDCENDAKATCRRLFANKQNQPFEPVRNTKTFVIGRMTKFEKQANREADRKARAENGNENGSGNENGDGSGSGSGCE